MQAVIAQTTQQVAAKVMSDAVPMVMDQIRAGMEQGIPIEQILQLGQNDQQQGVGGAIPADSFLPQ